MSSHWAIFIKTKNKNWYTKAHVIQLKTIALVQSTLETVDLCIKFAQSKKRHTGGRGGEIVYKTNKILAFFYIFNHWHQILL